jgi:excisionase family DNA binding protein
MQHQNELPPAPFKLLFSEKDSALALGISKRSVQKLIAAGLLKPRRIGRRVLIHRRDLEEFARRDHPGVMAPVKNATSKPKINATVEEPSLADSHATTCQLNRKSLILASRSKSGQSAAPNRTEAR